MNLDDVLWIMICAGLFLSIATLRAELKEHQLHRGLEDERLAQQRTLWPRVDAPAEPDPQARTIRTVISEPRSPVHRRPQQDSAPARRRFYLPRTSLPTTSEHLE